MTTPSLTLLKTRLQDQHRTLNTLNADLIRRLIEFAAMHNKWEDPFTTGKTFNETINYLRMIRTEALTAPNLQLISKATSVACLEDLGKELDEEITCHLALQQSLQAMSDDTSTASSFPIDQD